MKLNKFQKSKSQQTSIVERLYAQHLSFHTFLDKLVLQYEDMNSIDILIAVRKMNTECFTRYSNILSRTGNINNPTPRSYFNVLSRIPASNMSLWNIHGQLARLLPLYREALATKELNPVVRMVIAHNYDKITYMKENLLHPLPEQLESA
jgi:hypothetical protein